VALRPRLSPGVLYSSGGFHIRGRTGAVKCAERPLPGSGVALETRVIDDRIKRTPSAAALTLRPRSLLRKGCTWFPIGLPPNSRMQPTGRTGAGLRAGDALR
jgi:hypothetical protein